MTIALGLDIGSSSVGSAWIDTDAADPEDRVVLGVSVFPAGVEETESKRGAPKNQDRRQKRSLRRSIARRAGRKRALRRLLAANRLLPTDPDELAKFFELNPWLLRRKALRQPLTPFEFGRVLVHLNQHRGALGIETDPDDKEEGKVKDAIDRLTGQLNGRTFGHFIADLMDQRRHHPLDAEGHPKTDKYFHDAVRNRRDAFEFHAHRALIRAEFDAIWNAQKNLDGPLGAILTDSLRRQLDDPTGDDKWRHRGVLFGQRRTYWDTGTLGRCDLEPTDRCVPVADMYAQRFRVVETANSMRIETRDGNSRPLTGEERDKVIGVLRKQKTASPKTIRKALGIHKQALKKKELPEDFYALNIERDPDRQINTDWFWRQIVVEGIGEAAWHGMTGTQRDSLNRAILRFDPQIEDDAERLRRGAINWWALNADQADRLVNGWRTRPVLEKRLSLSRRAIINLLPYMEQFDNVAGRWPTQIEARLAFAEDPASPATREQRVRYQMGASALTKADRHYLRKHPNLLPPAPMLSNPVVRKAIHEVRRHVLAYLRRFGRKPDRVVIEFARSAKQSGRIRDAALRANRRRESVRKAIIEELQLDKRSFNQQRAGVDRVVLCRQQRNICPYKGRTITDQQAANGDDVEIDHIVPYSRCGDNSLNNKVLCCRQANRGKGRQTPKEWLGEKFDEFLQRLAHIQKPARDGLEYFSPKDHARKWENLNRDVRAEDEWANSQLTDTAYAATQVQAYLKDALYGNSNDGTRRVFVTKGAYTAMLRRDWQLFQTLADPSTEQEGNSNRHPQSIGAKNRGDHRHHAIDAAVIALTGPDIIPRLARQAAEAEDYRDRTGYRPKRMPLAPPWGTVEQFRRDILSRVFDVFDPSDADGDPESGHALVVSHRPVKRRIVGRLHEDTAYGPVVGPLPAHRTETPDTLFTNRIAAANLTPNHLRVPDGWDELSAQLDDPGVTASTQRAVRRHLARLVDPSPHKSGIVRDRSLRDRLRKCLRANGLDPDAFGRNDIKQLVDSGKLRLPSGVPIRTVVLLRTNTDPVVIRQRVWEPATDRVVCNRDPRTRRVYIGANNHHIEIREDTKTGRWSGKVVAMFEAARRVRRDGRDAVDRQDCGAKRFVMSLAQGETVYMRHPKTGQPDYFVVFKLDKPQTVHFMHHWDARLSQSASGNPTREDVPVTPDKLRSLAVEPGRAPYKVRVDPLGKIRRLERD